MNILNSPVDSRAESGMSSSASAAAVKVQKVIRSHSMWRMLSNSAVVVEEYWWHAMNYVRSNHSTISFYDDSKPETVVSKLTRVRWNASKIDSRHRYGHNLYIYFEKWRETEALLPFFYWLDVGEGKELDLKECRRSDLEQQCIKYLGPKVRENYEYLILNGKIVHKLTKNVLDTTHGLDETKWIFVMSTFKELCVGQKMKGRFHHSSFLAGGAKLASGRLVVQNGVLKMISTHSGHYLPEEDCLENFLSFLRENRVNLYEVEIHKASEDSDDSSNAIKSNGDAELSLNGNFQEPKIVET